MMIATGVDVILEAHLHVKTKADLAARAVLGGNVDPLPKDIGLLIKEMTVQAHGVLRPSKRKRPRNTGQSGTFRTSFDVRQG